MDIICHLKGELRSVAEVGVRFLAPSADENSQVRNSQVRDGDTPSPEAAKAALCP